MWMVAMKFTPVAIDAAEVRLRATQVLASQGIPAPLWRSVPRWENLPAAVEEVGYPALLRPSYVLSGRGMTIVRSPADVERYIRTQAHAPLTKPLLIDQFLEGAVELDVDAVSDGRDVQSVVMEQLEECGVHSGDSAEVYPVQTVDRDVLETVEEYTRILTRAFSVVGLMNVQYAVQGKRVYVLEVNPRASRSVPFASKASDIPLADLAVRAILGQPLCDLNLGPPQTDRICVKEVVLPFRTFPGLVPVLGPEMQSTGESMGIGDTFGVAYWKALLGAGMKGLPFGRPVYLSLPNGDGGLSSPLAEGLINAGCSIVTPGTPVNVADLGLIVALGRSQADISLLRRAVEMGVPYISTSGGVRGLALALREGKPHLEAASLW